MAKERKPRAFAPAGRHARTRSRRPSPRSPTSPAIGSRSSSTWRSRRRRRRPSSGSSPSRCPASGPVPSGTWSAATSSPTRSAPILPRRARSRRLVHAFQGPPLARIALGDEGVNDLLAVGGGDAALALCLWRVLSDRTRRSGSGAFRSSTSSPPTTSGRGRHRPARGGAPTATTPCCSSRPSRPSSRRRGSASGRRRRRGRHGPRRRGSAARSSGRRSRPRCESRAPGSPAPPRRPRARRGGRSRPEGGGPTEGRGGDPPRHRRRRGGPSRARRGEGPRRQGRGDGGPSRAGSRPGGGARRRSSGRAGARADLAPAPSAERAAPATEESEASEAETWLFPVYTREFYDSLDRWDRRIQRAAFKQAHLLAQDHRHPSLRALPLEGLPGYYRVRVATDVRLIYRRPERQNVIEVLSLIDREDLDRYIRQAKTRG